MRNQKQQNNRTTQTSYGVSLSIGALDISHKHHILNILRELRVLCG